MQPLLKWPGGKSAELLHIKQNLPETFDRYFEPFVGGGACFLNVEASHYLINDKCEDLIRLYHCISQQDDPFFDYLALMMKIWTKMGDLTAAELHEFKLAYQQKNHHNISEVVDRLYADINRINPVSLATAKNSFSHAINKKLLNVSRLELKHGKFSDEDMIANLVCAIKSGFYLHIRNLYNSKPSNPSLAAACFVFIREYCYSSMFRYNSKGDFNVAYGGVSYNKKNLNKKLAYWKTSDVINKFNKTTICNLDFSQFLGENLPTSDDFIFIDPPYDTEFSTYAGNEFKSSDQKRLADYLINECPAKWMAVIKQTDYITGLYTNPKINIQAINKRYPVNFKNRNDQQVEHLIITNYRAVPLQPELA